MPVKLISFQGYPSLDEPAETTANKQPIEEGRCSEIGVYCEDYGSISSPREVACNHILRYYCPIHGKCAML